MKKMIYAVMALFAVSIFFVAVGTSSCQEFPKGTIALYGQSEISGWDTLEASSMIGARLWTKTDDYLGQISDLVVDPGTGRILEVILSDVPGKGGESVAVPFATLSHTGDSIFIFNRPEEYMRHFTNEGGPGPAFEKPFSHWATTRYLYSVRPLPTGAFRVSRLIGGPVQTSKGEKVARVNDFVIDFSNNRVVYSVLSEVGGSQGKMVAVPFRELSKPGKNFFVLKTTAAKLAAAPSFNEQADISNLRFAQNVYKYFGQQPYWTEERTR